MNLDSSHGFEESHVPKVVTSDFDFLFIAVGANSSRERPETDRPTLMREPRKKVR